MSPDAYLILLEIAEPRRSGHPSIPVLRDRLLAAVDALYIQEGERTPVINLLFWRGELVSAKRETI